MTDDLLPRVVDMLVGRWSGPLAFRFVLQPVMATLLAIRAGVRDARAGRPAFLWDVLAHREHRAERLRQAWGEVRRVFALAIVLDLAYGLVVYGWIYPLQTLLVAVVLALVPYAALRGPVRRLAGRLHPPPR